ncbi:MAG: prepilin-type N-terminal cleavage/methylation domain-containing protein [Byssovorax sp.]
MRPSIAQARAPRRRRGGYTVVEVMMALAILTLGASGVIAVQKAALLGNTNARNLATANAIAKSWVERLRTDALVWNAPGNGDDIGETSWLKQSDPNNPNQPWLTPNEVLAPALAGSPDSDVLGVDIFPADPGPPASAFCTQLRFTRFPQNVLPAYRKMIRAEIRVFWERSGKPIDCAIAPNPVEGDVGRYGFVYVTTAVMQNTAP